MWSFAMYRIITKANQNFFIINILLLPLTMALLFRVDQFTDVTERCKSEKKLSYILNEDKPAMYISIDPNKPKGKMKVKKRREVLRHDEIFKKFLPINQEKKDFTSMNKFPNKFDPLNKKFLNNARAAFTHILKTQKELFNLYDNKTFDCSVEFETELPKGDKTNGKYDALSLIIVELAHNSIMPVELPNFGSLLDGPSQSKRKLKQRPFAKFWHIPNSRVEVVTSGKNGRTYKNVTKRAQYSERIWPGNNPNFLLSGQLSGFDSIDYRTKIDPQHIVKPENLYSHFDTPARVTINVKDWTPDSHIYMVVTSYKYLRQGQACQADKEFDCTTTQSFLSSTTDHMCMSMSLACDGIPNCGQDYLPNMDENCFKIHWSSVLLSLVSYILLAITLLLCLSCFARVLIQWSVRSSLAELHRGVTSPSGSFRSPSRFFSFLGTTLSTRWERPPPTYDEAMKHINPDLVNQPPPNPPAYSDTVNGRSSIVSFSTGRRRFGRGYLRRHRSSSSSIGGGNGMIQTPPPEYQSTESGLHRLHLELDLEGVHNPLNPNTNEVQDSSSNRRRSRNEERHGSRRNNPLATSRSINRIRYARYDRSNCVLEASESFETPDAELSVEMPVERPGTSSEESKSHAELLSNMPHNPNVIILPPSENFNRSNDNQLLSSASSVISKPDVKLNIDCQKALAIENKDNVVTISQVPTRKCNSAVDLSDNQGVEHQNFHITEEKNKDGDDNDEDIFDDDILSPTLTSPVASTLSLATLSNSSETLFSDTFRQTMTSPGSAESHHSYASNLSSSSEASVKTVVRVNSIATVEAEICVNKSE